MTFNLSTTHRGTPVFDPNDAILHTLGGLSGGVIKGDTTIGNFLSSTFADGGTLTTGTVEGWVKSGTSTGRKVAIQRDGWFYIGTDAGIPYAEYSYGGTAKVVTGGSAITDGAWHHIALVFNATAVSLYVDGNRVATNANAGTAVAASNPGFYVGGYAAATGWDWPGSVDEVRLSYTARYTGTTYTVPASAFDIDTDTQVIFHFDGNGNGSFPRINLFTNPSAEVDLTGWSSTNVTIARYTTTTWQTPSVVRGTYANPTSALAGWFGGTVTGLTVGETYTASMMVYRASASYPAQLVVNDGTNKYGPQAQMGSSDWEMLRMTFTAAASSATVGITNPTAVSTASVAIIVDWLTVERGANGSPFAGDTIPRDGYTYNWTGAKHASTSIAKPGRVNQCINPSFGSGTRYGWNGSTVAGTFTVDTTEGIFGNKNCMKVIPTSTGTGDILKGTSGSGNTAEMCPVTPGKTYTISAYVKSSQLSSARITLYGANSSGVVTATSYTASGYDNTTTVGGGQWTRYKNTVTVAAGDVYLVPTINGSWTGGATYYVDGIMIEEAGNAGKFFNGQTTNDWVTNAWTGTAFQSPSTQSLTPITSPTVLGTYTGAVTTSSGTHTVDVTDTPSSSEVLILIDAWAMSTAHPPSTAVSGLGATWVPIPGGTEYHTAWMGTGATSSGTVTVTSASTGSAYRSAKVVRVQGVTPDAVFRMTTSGSDQHYATPNQIVIGVGRSNSTTGYPFGERNFPSLWTEDSNPVVISAHTWNTSWMRPVSQDLVYHEGSAWGGAILVGSPRANTRIRRRNGFYRAGMESSGGTTNGGIPAGVQTAVVHSGKAAAGGVTTGTNASMTLGGGLGYAPILPNKQYTLSVWVYCSAARTIGLAPTWKHNGQAAISTGTAQTTAVPANTWTQLTWTGLSAFDPASYGAYYAGAQVTFTAVVGDAFYADEWQIDEGPVPLSFLDYTYTPAVDEIVYPEGEKYVSTVELYQPSSYSTVLLGPAALHLKLRQAGAWVTYPGKAKARVSGAWLEAKLKYWNGSSWIQKS